MITKLYKLPDNYMAWHVFSFFYFVILLFIVFFFSSWKSNTLNWYWELEFSCQTNNRDTRLIRSWPAAVKSLQSCRTLCDPIDGSPPGSPIPGIFQARVLEWVLDAYFWNIISVDFWESGWWQIVKSNLLVKFPSQRRDSKSSICQPHTPPPTILYSGLLFYPVAMK